MLPGTAVTAEVLADFLSELPVYTLPELPEGLDVLVPVLSRLLTEEYRSLYLPPDDVPQPEVNTTTPVKAKNQTQPRRHPNNVFTELNIITRHIIIIHNTKTMPLYYFDGSKDIFTFLPG